MIQILTYSGKKDNLEGVNVVINNFHDALSLDEFDINIIDLKDSNIWKNSANNSDTVNVIKDLISLSIMISQSIKSNIIIIYPQNITYSYNYASSTRGYTYKNHCELKDMIAKVNINILSFLYEPFKKIETFYENTKTKIYDNEMLASFAFGNIIPADVLTKSFKSDKPTTIKCDNVIITTLNIDSYDQLILFLRRINLIEEKEETPEWIKNEKMFDDEKQLEIIEEKEQIIKDAEIKIEQATKIIRENERYKSILYTSGDELENIVFEILYKMLGCDLSKFNDEKDEDFNFELNNKIYIGEIKGINTNVKKQNVAQLYTHVAKYSDSHIDKNEEEIISLLIINHQRKTPLYNRQEVHKDVINIAKRNKSLIIETITLLRMFEKYLAKTLSREKIIDILESNIGILTDSQF